MPLSYIVIMVYYILGSCMLCLNVKHTKKCLYKLCHTNGSMNRYIYIAFWCSYNFQNATLECTYLIIQLILGFRCSTHVNPFKCVPWYFIKWYYSIKKQFREGVSLSQQWHIILCIICLSYNHATYILQVS